MKTRPPTQATKSKEAARSQLGRVLQKIDRQIERLEARRARTWRAYSKAFNAVAARAA
jgi:hypothetical protein